MGRQSSIRELLEAARSEIVRFSPTEALEAQGEGAIIVDVRCADDRRAEGTVPGALAFPLSVLPWRADPESDTRDERIADRSARLILMCADGYSSSLAAATLTEMGFDQVGDMAGGFHAWEAQGLPLQPGA